MSTLSTLLIAPETDLITIKDEVQAISAALTPEIIGGYTTLKHITDAIAMRIARKRKTDMLIYLGHGTITGLPLNDGCLGISDLCRFVKSCNIRYVVLNSCESEFIAMAIHHETEATVICTVISVADIQAYTTSRLLAEAISSGMSVEEAYEVARPSGAGVQTYRIFPDPNERRSQSGDNEHTTIQLMREMLAYQLAQVIAQVKQMIDEERHQRSEDTRRLEDKIDQHRSELIGAITILSEQSKNTVSLPRNYIAVYTVAFVFLAVPIPLYFYEIRNYIGISVYAAIIIAWLFYGMSHQTFAYLWGFIANRSKKP